MRTSRVVEVVVRRDTHITQNAAARFGHYGSKIKSDDKNHTKHFCNINGNGQYTEKLY